MVNGVGKRGAVLVRPSQYRRVTRQVRGISTLFPVLAVLIGLLAFIAASEPAQAQTPPVPAVVKVAFIGDAGISNNAKAVLQLIENQGADFVLHQGDFAYGNEDAAAARAWNDQVNAILGPDYPYFGSVGNHDRGAWSTYRGLFLDRLSRIPGANCQGDYGVNAACHYKGIFFILSGVGTRGSGHVPFIQTQLSQDNSTWSICTWHKNQAAMQVGGKGNEVGWPAYEACREGGALIATGHEHSYSRTKTLDNMQSQSIDSNWPDRDNVRVAPGSTFAFVSGLGGRTPRNQERCRPTSYPYGCKGEWASIYASDQGAKSGALFIEFNFGGDVNKARGRFINIDGNIIDEFMISTASANSAPVAADDSASTGEASAVNINVLANDTDADGDALKVTNLTQPTNGGVTLNSNNTVKYTPDAGFSGADSFTYTANDGLVDSNIATVRVSVTPGNTAPVAVDDSASTGEASAVTIGVLTNDTDVDGDALKVTNLTQPSNGGVTLNSDNTVTYTPDAGFSGDDSFTYTANDGLVDSNIATVNVSVSVVTPQTITLEVRDGWDQKNGKTLSDDGKVFMIKVSDNQWWDVAAGFYTSFEFTGPTVPASATIQSVKVYVEHWEEQGMNNGSVQWEVATGSLNSPNVVGSIVAPMHVDEANEATDEWDVCTSAACTPSLVNDLKFVIRNQDAQGKLTKPDFLSVEVTYK